MYPEELVHALIGLLNPDYYRSESFTLKPEDEPMVRRILIERPTIRPNLYQSLKGIAMASAVLDTRQYTHDDLEIMLIGGGMNLPKQDLYMLWARYPDYYPSIEITHHACSQNYIDTGIRGVEGMTDKECLDMLHKINIEFDETMLGLILKRVDLQLLPVELFVSLCSKLRCGDYTAIGMYEMLWKKRSDLQWLVGRDK
jgi:hypothetical protein